MWYRSGSYAPALLAAVLLSTALVVLVRVFPLPPWQEVKIYSGYSVVDNRRLLLAYAGICLAVLAAPLLAARWRRALREAKPGPAPATEAETPTRVSLLAALILLPVTIALFLGPWIAYGPLDGHELVHLGYLSEIGHGRVLNLDTYVTYGPLLGYSIYAFMLLFGFNLVGFRLYWNVSCVAFFAFVIAVVMPRFRSRLLFALFLLFSILYTSSHYYFEPGEGIRWGWANPWRHGWAPLAILVLYPRLAASARAWPRIAAGALPVLAGFFAQETLGIGAVTLGAAVGIAAWRSHPRRLSRDLLLFVAGAAIGLGIALLPALLRGAPIEYMGTTWRIPRLFMKGAGASPYPLPFTEGWTLGKSVYVLFPAGTLVLFLYQWVRTLRGGAAAPALIGLYAVLSYVTVLVRADSYHIYNVAFAPLLLAFLTLDEWMAATRRFPRRVLVTAVTGFLLLAALWVPPGVSHLAGAVASRVADPWPGPPAGWVRIPGPRGGVWTPPCQWVRFSGGRSVFDPGAVTMIAELSRDRETIITDSGSSLYYFLADVPNATPFTDISSQCISGEDRALLRRASLESNARFIFLDQGTSLRYGTEVPDSYAEVLDYGGFSALMLRDRMGAVLEELRSGSVPMDGAWPAILGAGILAATGNRENAVSTLQAAIERFPRDEALLSQTARVLLEAGLSAEAAEGYRRMLELEPLHYYAYYRLAMARMAAGDSASARRALEEGIRVFPEQELLLEQLARLCESMGDLEGAADAWSRALEMAPNSSLVAYELGLALVRVRRPEEAVEILGDLSDRFPDDPAVWVALGNAQYVADRKPAAARSFEAAMRIDPSLPQPYFNLVRVHLTLGDTLQAVGYLRRYLERDSTSDYGQRAKVALEDLAARGYR